MASLPPLMSVLNRNLTCKQAHRHHQAELKLNQPAHTQSLNCQRERHQQKMKKRLKA